MTIRPVIRFGERERAQFRGVTRERARQKARNELTVIGEMWEREVRKLTLAEAPRRDGSRHKKNTTHLDQSFTHRITEGPDQGFPMTLDLTIKPGVEAKKIAALEHGVKKTYPIPRVRRDTQRDGPLRWSFHPKDLSERVAWTGQVTWKPTGRIREGYGFMRRALAAVLARRGGAV